MSKFLVSLKQLESWFQRQKRVLPWRDQPSVYRVWISEIMLQQTQVVTVVPYFERFMNRFPSVKSLAEAREEDVLHLWAGLGYYSRARNLHRAAQMIVNRGEFPKNREQWLEIPGVGQYTAGAILSISMDLPEAILDGNVERVLSRVRRISRKRGDVPYKARLWRISSLFVNAAFREKIPPSILNQALMELGATVCSPKRPQCLLCPLQSFCKASQTGEQDAYPPKKKPKEWVKVKEHLNCLLDQKGKVLLRKRKAGEWRAGLWDLMESVPSDLGLPVQPLGQIETRHIVTRHKIERSTQVWTLKSSETVLRAAEPRAQFKVNGRSRGGVKAKGSAKGGESEVSLMDEFRWVSIEDPEVAIGSALKRTLQAIRERFI